MEGHTKKTIGEYGGAVRFFMTIGIFIALYIVGMLLPLEMTPHYYNYMSRIWNWTELLILLMAVYYIIKAKVFRWKQAVIALSLGAICLISLFRDPRTADILVTSVCVMAAFYAGCRLYELSSVENTTMAAGLTGSVRSFLLGAAISVPLAVLNVLYFSFTRQIRIGNVLASAAFALKPAIAEEVVFRFFLLAYSYYLFHGKVEKRALTVCIYLLLVVPHTTLHYPDLFLSSPGEAILMCLLNGVVFGLPMALLMKKKNLQTAMGMHWFIDFLRFAAGF